MKEKKNRAAIYCRLSVDDGVDQQSQSIANQKEVLTEYCLENGFIIENIYIDDGISGTTFDRPGFNKMISSIENGNIDIVITKDLSRLGRDYLSAGYYTEKYFPEHNIRYIAINDKVDTAQGLDDIVPLKNIMNEFYARDISKKIRFTVGNIMSKGDSKKAGKALYGYKYDNNSNRIINPKEAKVVKRIFKLFIEGNSISSICNILSKDRIPNPSTSNKEKLSYTWRYKTIYSIISNQEYLGHYIRKKTQTLFKSNKVLKIPKEEQYIFKNKYDPIIDVDTFNLAQSLLESTKNQTKDILKKNPYAGLCYCAICGKRLIYNKHTSGSGYTE